MDDDATLDARVREAFATDARVGDAFETAVAARAAQHSRRLRQRQRIVLALVGFGVAGGLVGIMVQPASAPTPRPTPAFHYRPPTPTPVRVSSDWSAVERGLAKAPHLHAWSPEERWQYRRSKGAPWIAEDRRGVRFFDGERFHRRDSSGPIWVSVDPKWVDADPFDPLRRLRESLGNVPGKNVAENGRRWLRFDSGSPQDGYRVTLWADPKTHRPLRIEEVRTPSSLTIRTHQIATTRFEYAAPPADWQRPAALRGVRRIDLDAFSTKWRARSVGVFDLAGQRIVVHALQVNARGDVFALWSGTGIGKLALTLTDDAGTTYVGGRQPQPERTLQRLQLGYLTWSPQATTPRAFPRRLTVTATVRGARQSIAQTLFAPSVKELPTFLAELAIPDVRATTGRLALRLTAARIGTPRAAAVLAAYRDAVACEAMGEQWLDLYQLLDRVGARSEALDSLRRAAQKANRDFSASPQALAAALHKEGM